MLSGLALGGRGAVELAADFRFSDGALRDDEIFDSALSVPGRYVVEIARRLLARDRGADWLVIANPLLPIRSDLLRGWVKGAAEESWIGTDEDGFPVLYCIPRRLASELERFLLLLSAQDGALDAELLGAVLGAPVVSRRLPMGRLGPPPPRGPNGWLNGDFRLEALKLQASLALKIVRSREDWRKVPFAIYYPMHAGDVLFVALASSKVEETPFSRQVVCSSYADIPEACGSLLSTIPLKLPWISRDGSVSEARYFERAVARLGAASEENFIVFSRILRLYYTTPFHLVDHARFALGQSITRFAQTLHGQDNGVARRFAGPAEPLRVLFHLNGGWGLKTYPKPAIEIVIRSLRAMGVECSVLGRPDLVEAGAASFESEDCATLRRLIEAHHLFVGVDSFPHHFARLRLGWPVIGLFGNTKPTNSDAAYRDDYQTSESHLSCNRCGAYEQCPVFGGADCINYARPDRVLRDILAMAGRLYGARPKEVENV